MKRIAILESYNNRGGLIKEVFLKASENLDITIFKAYNEELYAFNYHWDL